MRFAKLSPPTVAALVLLCLSSSVDVMAQDSPSAAINAVESGEPIQPLTLEQAVEIALAENLGLVAERFSQLTAREEVAIASAEFLPTFFATARTNVNQQPSAASDLDGAPRPRNANDRANAGVSQKIVTGATVDLTTNLDRSESNSTFRQNLIFDADVALSITQPLMRGAGIAANRARKRRALIGVERSDLTFLARAYDVIRDTEISFYDLAFALRNLEVQQGGLEAAVKFLDENEARLDAGLATELDVMQARVAVANRQSVILTARQRVRDAGDLLLVTLGKQGFAGLPEPAGITFATPGPISTERAYGRAIEYDPEIRNVSALIQQLELDVTLANSQKRPRLDLGGAIGYTGRDAENIWSAIDGIPRTSGYNWQVDLTLSLPWGLQEGRARLRQAGLQLEQQRALLVQLEQNLLVRVRAAVRAVETDEQTVTSNSIAADLSARETELETAKFNAGLSTSRLVVEARQREDEARIRETQAQISLEQNLARLRRIDGSALDHFGIEIPET